MEDQTSERKKSANQLSRIEMKEERFNKLGDRSIKMI